MTMNEAAELALVHLDAASVNGQMAQHRAQRGDSVSAAEHARMAVQDIKLAESALRGAGAQRPGAFVHKPLELHQLDTPDTRALLAGLEALLPVAERIDSSRGRALDKPVAGSAGLDLAAVVNQLRHRLMLDIHGPSESVTGGLE